MLPIAHSIIAALRPDLPATYTVKAGDTVSSIAEAFELPTPAILTLNGLSWNSLVHEGQILKLSPEPTKKRAGSPARLAAGGYVVSPGDTVTTIAGRLGISAEALTAHNGLQPDSTIYAGQMLSVPGATRPTVERSASTAMPVIASAPTVLSASTRSDGEADESAQADTSTGVPFDAADLPLAEAPALIVVQVPKKPAVLATKAPAANPAPVTQASAPAPAPEATASGGVGQPVAGSITPLNDERRANAQVIISVGRELGVPDYGIVIALATAMQESSLRNINWGDRDSVGLYQQRPSSGWGSVEQIMDAGYATRLFFGGPQNPNKGKTRGLLDITNWQSMTLTEAAQRVQISAFPKAYAKWEPSAWAWLYELT
jgi:LysM repeat protein